MKLLIFISNFIKNPVYFEILSKKKQQAEENQLFALFAFAAALDFEDCYSSSLFAFRFTQIGWYSFDM